MINIRACTTKLRFVRLVSKNISNRSKLSIYSKREVPKNDKSNDIAFGGGQVDSLRRSYGHPDLFGTLTEENKYPNEAQEDEISVEKDENNFRPVHKRKRILDYIFEIKNLARKGQTKEAIELYDSLFPMGVKVDSQFLFTVVIQICGEVGYTKKAFQVLKEMTDRGFRATAAILTGLFNSCAECPFPDYGLRKAGMLREKMLFKGWQGTNITYHAMIKAFGKCGDIETAFELVDEMKEKKLFISDETFAFILMSCISNKESGFGYAMLVLNKMEKLKIRPSVYTFDLMLRATRDCQFGPQQIVSQVLLKYKPAQLISESNQVENKPNLMLLKVGSEQNKQEEDEKEEKKVVANSLNIESLLPSCQNHSVNFWENSVRTSMDDGKPIEKSQLLGFKPIERRSDRLALLGGSSGIISKMIELRLEASIKTFTLLLDCIFPSEESELNLLKEMDRVRIKPDIGFINTLIKRRCLRKEPLQARNALDIMSQYALRPDVATFGTLAMTCLNQKDGENLLKEMANSDLKANVKILGALVGNARIASNYLYVVFLMNQFSSLNIKPDTKVCRDLEWMKTKGKEALLNKERGIKNCYVLRDKKGFEIFCKFYKPWLRKTEIEMAEHPWQQYQKEIVINKEQEETK